MNNKRIQSIQVIRAVAFILIFLSHAEVLAGGTTGVSLFLVLSGFCMAYAYWERLGGVQKTGNIKDNAAFSAQKILRLYPLHICTLLAVAAATVLILLRKGFPAKETAQQAVYFVMNAGLLQSWIPFRDGYFSFNAVSWYLSVIVFCYFMFPAILRGIQNNTYKGNVLRTISVVIVMITIAIVLAIGHSFFNWSNAFLKWTVYICPIYRLGDFFVGAFLGYSFLVCERRHDIRCYTVLEVIVIIIFIIQIILYNVSKIPTLITYSLFWLPTSAAIVFLFSRGGAVSSLLSKSKLLLWIGNISGDAFLIHQLAIKAVEYIIHDKAAMTIVSFILTIVCTLIYKKVEPILLKVIFFKRCKTE